MRKLFNKGLEKYIRFLVKHPFIIIAIVLGIVILSLTFASSIEQKSMDNRDTLPDNVKTISAFETIENNFGGSESAMIAIELSPNVKDSNEPKDIRDPKVLQYVKILTKLSSRIDNVISVSSASQIFAQANEGLLPKSWNTIKSIYNSNPALKNYISSDFTLTIITLRLSDGYEEDELLGELNNLIEQTPKPKGLKASPAGSPIEGPILNQQIGGDQAKTSQLSLIAIVVILIIMLRSIKFAVAPLITIGVGVILAFGYIGLLGMDISPATSGVISMIMGIGIDFGIQVITRFRQELKDKPTIAEAMVLTFRQVFIPMATTTLAALIGFKAMTMGQLSFLGELGEIMSYGVIGCFVAAITILPAILVVFERSHRKINAIFKSIF